MRLDSTGAAHTRQINSVAGSIAAFAGDDKKTNPGGAVTAANCCWFSSAG